MRIFTYPISIFDSFTCGIGIVNLFRIYISFFREKDRESELDLSHVYYAYSEEGAALALGGTGSHRPKARGEGGAKGRPKTAAGKEGGRPKTSKESKKKTRTADINSLLQ